MKRIAPLDRSIRSAAAELEPIGYTPVVFVPEVPAPKAIELDERHGWAAWDSAVAELDNAQEVAT